MDRRKFPRLGITLTLETSCPCHRCPTVIQPFSAMYSIAMKVETPSACWPLCESCVKKEIEQRAVILREDYETKKTG